LTRLTVSQTHEECLRSAQYHRNAYVIYFDMFSFIRRYVKAALPDRFLLYYYFKRCSEPEIRMLDQLVKPSTTAIDIGACIGQYTYALSRLVGRRGRVIAVEPIPWSADFLRSACKLMPSAVHIEECSLSSKEGTGLISIPLINDQQMTGLASLQDKFKCDTLKVHVTMHTLDRLMEKYDGEVSFIKCDVEGHELDVIKGALRTIKKHRPCLLVEVEQRHIDYPIDDFFSFVASLGYTGHFLYKDKLTSIEEFDLSAHQPHVELEDMDWRTGTIPGYINNFIFMPVR